MNALYEEIDRLKAVNGELLEALKDCVERLSAYRSLRLSFPLTEKKARAAIAKAEVAP